MTVNKGASLPYHGLWYAYTVRETSVFGVMIICPKMYKRYNLSGYAYIA